LTLEKITTQQIKKHRNINSQIIMKQWEAETKQLFHRGQNWIW